MHVDKQGPHVWVWEGNLLARVRSRVRKGDPVFLPAVSRLQEEAARSLTAGPYSVMSKEAAPPSGNKHDYMSMGPYWWPNPDTPDGLPYVRRDGEVNPEREKLDSTPLKHLCAHVETLALAYYMTRQEPYASRAAQLLRTWFLDPATHMNPHLEFGQSIPGICTGRDIGIIDTHILSRVVDSVGLLAEAEAWTDSYRQGLQEWFDAT